MTSQHDTVRLPQSIAASLGSIAEATLLADRRGSRTWRVRLDNGTELAVKAAYDNPDDTGVHDGARLLAAREAAALTAMVDIASGYLHAHGEINLATWIAVRWVDAPTIQKRWREARTTDTPTARRNAIASAVQASTALSELHERGWRHGDLQAAHILCGEGHAHLIDFALAQGPRGEPLTPRIPYRGGLVHLDAPELAQALLDDPGHVTITVAAEVFSFAAVLTTCWTGRWMYDYGGNPWEVPMERILARIATGRRERLVDQRPWEWAGLEAVLNEALDPDPVNRPTSNDIAVALEYLGSQLADPVESYLGDQLRKPVLPQSSLDGSATIPLVAPVSWSNASGST